MNSGIYIITNIINNKVYIGSSQDIKRRFYLHKHYLNKKNHTNIHLQTAWELYGKQNFVFSILEFVEKNEILLEKEKYYIDYFCSTDREKGYNICEDTTAPMRNRKHTPSSIEKMKQVKIGENNSFFGKHHTGQTKQKIRDAKIGTKLSEEHKQKIAFKSHFKNGENHIKAKLTFEIANLIRQEFKNCQTKYGFFKKMAIQYNVSTDTIKRIVNNKSYIFEDKNAY
jgi:group I intron endonuclease